LGDAIKVKHHLDHNLFKALTNEQFQKVSKFACFSWVTKFGMQAYVGQICSPIVHLRFSVNF